MHGGNIRWQTISGPTSSTGIHGPKSFDGRQGVSGRGLQLGLSACRRRPCDQPALPRFEAQRQIRNHCPRADDMAIQRAKRAQMPFVVEINEGWQAANLPGASSRYAGSLIASHQIGGKSQPASRPAARAKRFANSARRQSASQRTRRSLVPKGRPPSATRACARPRPPSAVPRRPWRPTSETAD